MWLGFHLPSHSSEPEIGPDQLFKMVFHGHPPFPRQRIKPTSQVGFKNTTKLPPCQQEITFGKIEYSSHFL